MLQILGIIFLLPFVLTYYLYKFILFDAPLFLVQYFYFNGSKFRAIKDKIQNHINECNELNRHIEELKSNYANLEMGKVDYGYAEYNDSSTFSYKRPTWQKRRNETNVYHCSRSIVSSAEQQPFKYVCKYFDIKQNEDSLQRFEELLNNFSAAENGKQLLIAEKETLLKSIESDVPFLIRKFRSKELSAKLGFEDIDLTDTYFPKFIFQYVSPGGNAEYSTNLVLNVDNLERFIHYLAHQISFRNSVQGQRQLMTRSLREKIKQRDGYTCKKCGISTKDEPHLLLEIDHIKPLSKGGLTEEKNLQTLCWKCNRTKSNKYEDNQVNVGQENNNKNILIVEQTEQEEQQEKRYSLNIYENLCVDTSCKEISTTNIVDCSVQEEMEKNINDTLINAKVVENGKIAEDIAEEIQNTSSLENKQAKSKLQIGKVIEYIVNIVRYIVGGMFSFVGIVNILIDGDEKVFSMLMALWGISLMPILYKQVFKKCKLSHTWEVLAQLLLPIICFILMGINATGNM